MKYGSIAVVLNYPLQNQIDIGHLDVLRIQWENMLKLFDEVHVISPRDNTKYNLKMPNVKIHSVSSKFKYFSPLKEISYLKKMIKQENIKLIRALAPSSGFVATKAADGKIPVVVSVHANRKLVEKSEGRSIKDFLIDLMEPIIYKKATLVPVISEFIKEHALGKGVPKEKLFLHNNFVDTNLFKPKKKRNKTPILFWAGRLTLVKGVDILIKMMSIILKQKKVLLQIAGNGPDEKRLEELVKNYNLQKNVEFLGSLDHNTKLSKQMANADIFVSPSLSGFTLIEAASCGLPIIAADIEWTSEIVKDEKTGILVKFGSSKKLAEGIMKLLQNPSLAERLGENARKLVETQFSLLAWKKRELEIYKKALSEFNKCKM